MSRSVISGSQDTAAHNTVGKRLGRKGRETRERIICAMLRLVGDPAGPAVTLTGVAREAGIQLPNLYVYFPDMGELVLVALSRVMETAERAYLDKLRARWPDEGLRQACLEFLCHYHEFWQQNARILHLRNAMADAADERLLVYRSEATRPLLDLLIAQMDCPADSLEAHNGNVATVILTGLERLATVLTSSHFPLATRRGWERNSDELIQGLLEAEAEVIGLTIAHRRVANAQASIAA
ncbi:TetR/AcrR family transcriptional regulator [Novosphingobium malaysiense]|uniref:TetR/AcrR family transcriptional regulator n=1 Tax=Novosphingobium malaysiense TaxID=1348853 RepID=UPI00068B0F18|nr:TetR/AcrR family transcriptional regulator [Novosphingobium malaysiense]